MFFPKRACRNKLAEQCCWQRFNIPRAQFSTSRRSNAAATNHYETLGVDPSAPQIEVKKAFYKLSKTYHPDLHPNDTTASQRFIAISEAYSTVGSPEKRAIYDRDVLHLHDRSSTSAEPQSGSFSSSQRGPAGGRPASGLSKRRSQFRGPPPSFYASGQYGNSANARARAESAENFARSSYNQTGQAYTGGTEGFTDSQTSSAGGFSPGQGAQRGFDNDVPHWDREGHFRTQEGYEQRFSARRMDTRRQGAYQNEMSWTSFWVLGSVSLGAMMVGSLFQAYMLPTPRVNLSTHASDRPPD